MSLHFSACLRGDESKRKLNLAKHGIDFRDARAIFEGPLVTAEDAREDYGETRYVALGLLEGIVVSIAYTERRFGSYHFHSQGPKA